MHISITVLDVIFLFDNVSICFFFCKQKTAYELRISDWSSDVCSSDLTRPASETASAWNEDTPELDDLLLNIRRSISGTPQTCMKRVRIEKYRPRPRHSPTSAMLQMMSLSEFRNASTYRDPSSCPGRKPTAPVVSDGCKVGCARGRD